MTYIIPNEGWPVTINVDIRDLTDSDVKEIAKLLVTKAVVVFKNQQLQIRDELNFLGKFGDLYHYKLKKEEHINAVTPDSKFVANVTGKKNAYGLPGLHGGTDNLDWHCNNPWQSDRMPIVYLYALAGSAGSRTSYNNSILAYKDLPIEWKEKIENLRLRVGMLYDNYSQFGKSFHMPTTEVDDYHPSIHQKNIGNIDVLYFPFLQIHGLLGYNDMKKEEAEIVNYLRDFILQDKYVYHHDWDDGDVVIADQWSGLHKRWAFKDMENRLLHRILANYSKVF